MKDKRIIASSKPVTVIHVAGKPYHYFHSEALGKCRAILISDDENSPRSTPPLSNEKSHRQMVDEILDEFEQPKAKEPAPTKCWDCGCKTIRIMTVGKHPPAYICGLCDLWLGDVDKYDSR